MFPVKGKYDIASLVDRSFPIASASFEVIEVTMLPQ
jgi:hypothetical protein